VVDFTDKYILITGASSGLGRALSIELDENGANLILTGRNEFELKNTLDLLKGKKNLIFPHDLNEVTQLKDLLDKIFNLDIAYDGFVHCAGIHTFLPLNLLKLQDIANAFHVNVYAPFLIIKELSKKKNFNPNASIVFISSVMASLGSSSLSVYSSSKAAQLGLVKSLAVELAKKQIRVNSISASLLESKILDKVKTKTSKNSFNEIENKHLLGVGSYDDVIPSIVHLLSDNSLWTTGSNMTVDGGYSSW
jgi:NAD(P)-dependent dehydrogenase (short-subunit alcohol dehydrogenase family)